MVVDMITLIYSVLNPHVALFMNFKAGRHCIVVSREFYSGTIIEMRLLRPNIYY